MESEIFSINLRVDKQVTDIEFHDVNYSTKIKNGYKKIIDGVSGKFYSGHLSAIMGPSGAGKTSLLNILTGYQIAGTSGNIKCSSPNKRKKILHYRKESCYILQDDNLPLLFTVQESMMMACNLKLNNITEKAKEFLINDILTNLGLLKTKNIRCHNLSGGQKKRLSIALELVDNPPIMFLDEPTTGLDSSSTTQCVQMLKKLANGGRIIVCTIHQPNAHTYELFDQVYMMANGRCVYQGTSMNTVPYLASVGLYCPHYHNPADYFMEVVSGDYGNYLDVLEIQAKEDKWKYVPTIKMSDNLTLVDNNIVYTDNGCINEAPPEWKRFFTLLRKNAIQLYRDWTISQLRVLLHFLIGLILGFTFQSCGRDATKIFSNLGFLQFGIVYLTYTSMMPAVLKFPSELVILKKENFNNWYKLSTYYAAFLVFDIPQQVLYSLVYCLGSYFISDQPLEIIRFTMVFTVLTLSSLSASGVGLIIGTLTDPINGIFFGSIILAVMISFGGFVIIFTHMSKVMYYFTYISYISFSTEGLMQAVYGFNRAPLNCPEEADYCHLTSSEDLLKSMGMESPNYWLDVGYLCCAFIFFRTIAFVTLRRKLSTS
ncbi:ATP-binding cassette sub-family G member 1-like isoform X1 [Diorhabda carinulata]|uniref:ATP-binding cassette sub-family G member 1-like isoform X1 n=1 Tax=Diorhabda carinulata TaxID=1163345 RepID=UPI0025A013C2|nr:ATP-binding cassette sub-family G member 1-like isoform X1 [Diorhabda carinulata]